MWPWRKKMIKAIFLNILIGGSLFIFIYMLQGTGETAVKAWTAEQETIQKNFSNDINNLESSIEKPLEPITIRRFPILSLSILLIIFFIVYRAPAAWAEISNFINSGKNNRTQHFTTISHQKKKFAKRNQNYHYHHQLRHYK
jgi:Na+/H+ antiporter NhaC